MMGFFCMRFLSIMFVLVIVWLHFSFMYVHHVFGGILVYKTVIKIQLHVFGYYEFMVAQVSLH